MPITIEAQLITPQLDTKKVMSIYNKKNNDSLSYGFCCLIYYMGYTVVGLLLAVCSVSCSGLCGEESLSEAG